MHLQGQCTVFLPVPGQIKCLGYSAESAGRTCDSESRCTKLAEMLVPDGSHRLLAIAPQIHAPIVCPSRFLLSSPHIAQLADPAYAEHITPASLLPQYLLAFEHRTESAHATAQAELSGYLALIRGKRLSCFFKLPGVCVMDILPGRGMWPGFAGLHNRL